MRLRDYQQDAVESVREKLSEFDSTLVVLPTGMGKTIVMAAICEPTVMEAIGGSAESRILVLAHRQELIFQAAEKIGRYLGESVDIEMGDRKSSFLHKSRIVVASKDSLHDRRLKEFDPSEFELILTDEAHHATAKTYTRVYEYFSNCKHVGVTATPDRTDEQALGQVFRSVACDVSIRDGIENGWLVPVRQRKIACESLNFRGINKVGNDFNQGQLAAILEQEGPLHEMTVPTIEAACGLPANTIDGLTSADPETAPERFRAMVKDRKRCLVFCARVHHAELVAQIINRWLPGSAEIVHGNTPADERARLFERFGSGELQFLANVGIATEGWDDPATDKRGVQIVSLMRPTQSRSLYAQMIGRGTRGLPGLVDAFDTPKERKAAIAASAKPSVLVLDFHDLTDSHNLIHTEDVLGGTFDDKVVSAARKKKAANPDDGEDVLETLYQAEDELEKAKQAAEDAQRQRIRAGVRYSQHEVDSADVWARAQIKRRRVPGWFATKPPSEAQIALLKRRGLYDPKQVTNMGEASQLLDAVTPKQRSVLSRAGYSQDEIGKMNSKKASAAIDVLARNNWRRAQGAVA